MNQRLETAQKRGYLRIAAEEAYLPPEMMVAFQEILSSGGGDKGFRSLWGHHAAGGEPSLLQLRLQDLGERRIADMDQLGIDHQIVALTNPGVELFDRATAREMARLANDRIAAACDAHPDRFSGLAAVPLQDLDFAVAELRRAVRELGLRGLIVNSHVRGEYLDDPRFDPLFAAAAELDVPIYLHPNTPSDRYIDPFLEAGLEAAIYGFGVEAGLHVLRLVVAGVFDRHPNLRLVVGHLGEALPFWLYRIDFLHAGHTRTGRYPGRPTLKHPPSHYFRNNIWLTTAGMAWAPAILFCRDVIGADRVLYAMDYPYQVEPDELVVHEELPIDPAQRRMLFETVARDVFRLKLPALA